MRLIAIAMNEGHAGARRAGRFFPNGAEVQLEVVDLPDGVDPPPVGKRADGSDIADPARIGKKSYLELKRDPRIKLVADGESSDRLTQVALDKAKQSASELAARVSSLEIDNAALRGEVDALQEALSKARAKGDGGKPASKPAEAAKPPDPGKPAEPAKS